MGLTAFGERERQDTFMEVSNFRAQVVHLRLKRGLGTHRVGGKLSCLQAQPSGRWLTVSAVEASTILTWLGRR